MGGGVNYKMVIGKNLPAYPDDNMPADALLSG